MFIIAYNPVTFKRKRVITKIKSLTWTKKFYETGSFELHLKDNELEKYDIIMQGKNSGIVMEIVDNYPDGVTAYGYDLKGLAEFRYVESLRSFTNYTAEGIYKSLANTYFKLGERAIEGLTITANQERGNKITFSAEKKYLADVFCELAKQTQTGFEINFNESNLIFDIVQSKRNENVVFSRKNRNIEKMTVTESAYNTYNVVYSVKKENDTETVVSSGSSTGILRRESYTDKPEEMETFLSGNGEVLNFIGEAGTKAEFGTDYNLGDEVKIIYSNYETWKIISEVILSYEPSCTKIYPTFGNEKNNPIKKILKG